MPSLPKSSEEERLNEARWSRDRRVEFERRSQFGQFTQALKRWDVQWRMRLVREKKPWNHASDLNPPLTYSKVEDVHAVLFGFLSELNFFTIAPSAAGKIAAEQMAERGEMWTDLVKWSLLNESNGLAHLDKFVHDGILFGSGFGELSYQKDLRTIQAEVFIPDALRKEGGNGPQMIRDLLGERLLSKLTKVAEDRYQFKFLDEDGQQKTGVGWIDKRHPMRAVDEISLVIERDWTYYDAPQPGNLAPWEIMVPGDITDLQTARNYWVRKHFTIGQIRRAFESGLFNAMSEQDMEVLEERARARGDDKGRVADVSDVSTSSGHYDQVDFKRDQNLNRGKIQSRRDQFEVFFEYSIEDFDGDGTQESMVRAVIEQAGPPVLLMRHRIEYLYPHGRRPHYNWDFIPVNHRFYGMGIPEVLEHMQLEENSYYQSRADVLEIITKPGGLYDPMSGLAPEHLKFHPGMFIKASLSDGPALQPFAFPTDPTLLFREQSGVELMAERAVGSTDMGLGRNPARPNAPRTLGGTAIVVRQQQLRTNVYLTRLILGTSNAPSGVSEFLRQYKELMASFMPEEKEFRILATNEIKKASRAQLAGRYDFVVDFGEDLNNPQLGLQNALLEYDRALANPLIAQNRQALWHITTRMMVASGDRSAKKILPPPTPDVDRAPLEPATVIHALSQGIPLKPLPTENHEAMLGAISEILRNPQAFSRFSPTTLPLLNDYAEKTLQFLMSQSVTQQFDQSAVQDRPSLGGNNSQGAAIVSRETAATPIGGNGDLGFE